MVVHGNARRARRRGLVSPRRSRPCGSCRAHPSAAAGETLSDVTARLLPPPRRRSPRAAGDRRSVRTRVQTDEGWLDFQDYFVRLQCRPIVRELAFDGADACAAAPDLLAALRDERLRAVIICPSNPFISVEPILALPAYATLSARARARHRGLPDHRRARGQRSDRQDDDGTRNRCRAPLRSLALRRSARWLCDGCRRRGGGGACGAR